MCTGVHSLPTGQGLLKSDDTIAISWESSSTPAHKRLLTGRHTGLLVRIMPHVGHDELVRECVYVHGRHMVVCVCVCDCPCQCTRCTRLPQVSHAWFCAGGGRVGTIASVHYAGSVKLSDI